jgi:hypothetical protein
MYSTTQSKEKRQANKWLENMKAIDHFGDPGVDGRVILDFDNVAYEMFRQGLLQMR